MAYYSADKATEIAGLDSQTWTEINTFSNPSKSATGFTADGFIAETFNVSYNTAATGYGINPSVVKATGPAVVVSSFDAGTPAGVGVAMKVIADAAYNAVWNDLADCVEVPEDTILEYGRCYYFDGTTYKFTDKYLENGIIGVHSDTAGFFMGDKGNQAKQLKIAVAGFVLAYVDKEYPCGTPLTCSINGTLTEMKKEDIRNNPHKIIGTYWKKETNDTWGFDDTFKANLLVAVNGRHWIRIR